jgi:hypothetical protein
VAYLTYAKSLREYAWLQELKPEEKSDRDEQIYYRALDKTYSKAWYEYHINQHMYFIDESVEMLLARHAEGMSVMMVTTISSQLGRLVEQYYWKFLLEKAAIRGVKVCEAAKSGGLLLASRRKHEHASWQAAARLIWKEHPRHSKMTVASIVKRRLKIDRSVKHISRVLTKLIEQSRGEPPRSCSAHSPDG